MRVCILGEFNLIQPITRWQFYNPLGGRVCQTLLKKHPLILFVRERFSMVAFDGRLKLGTLCPLFQNVCGFLLLYFSCFELLCYTIVNQAFSLLLLALPVE